MGAVTAVARHIWRSENVPDPYGTGHHRQIRAANSSQAVRGGQRLSANKVIRDKQDSRPPD